MTTTPSPKLWTRILNEGIFQNDDFAQGEETFSQRIIRAPIIFDDTPKTSQKGTFAFEKHLSEYGNLGLPFPTVWVEGQLLGSAERTGMTYLWGGLVDSVRTDHGGWNVGIHAFCASSKCSPKGCGVILFDLDPAGNPLQDSFRFGLSASGRIDKDSRVGAGWATAAACQWIFQTLELLGCKNVSLAPTENNSKQVRRATKRHGEVEHSYRYHILTIKPAGSKRDTPGMPLSLMPRHKVRGHFTYYGPAYNKGLLFGKLEGKVYVPPHARGDERHGKVEKDYRVSSSNQK